MLSLYFKDFICIIPFFLAFSFFWIFFIKNNFHSVRINPNFNDIINNSKFLKKVHYSFLVNWVYSNFLFIYLYLYFIKLDFNSFWFNHLRISNFNFNLIIIIITIALFLLFLIKFLKNSNVNYNIDYFSAIVNIIIFLPIIFLSNNMYSFLFILELISLLILYKFSVSRSWFNNSINLNNRLLPKSYLNMIFFQYWANFFSSMLIMFSLFSLIYIFGSSEWFFLEVINNNNYLYNNYFLVYIWTSFFIGIFFKIGFTPLHLFKIEVYKGIPFISIFFYTTWYFLSFFLFFVTIIFSYLSVLKIYFNIIFFTFILVGLLYSIILLFDVNLVKSFFAYSTVVNAMNFIIVLYLLIN